MTQFLRVAMRRALVRNGAILFVAASAQSLSAQDTASGQRIGDNSWRLNAAVGSWVPRSAVIVGADGRDTRLGSGPSFSLDLSYAWTESVALYGGGIVAFSRVTLGSAIQPTVVGPSDQTTVMGASGGLFLTSPRGWFGERLRPTLRLGAGLKGYAFDLEGTDGQWRPSGDFGLGFRGSSGGPIEVSAEVRYLPSSFDQGKLPIRGIVPQAQRQTDLILAIGITVRP